MDTFPERILLERADAVLEEPAAQVLVDHPLGHFVHMKKREVMHEE